MPDCHEILVRSFSKILVNTVCRIKDAAKNGFELKLDKPALNDIFKRYFDEIRAYTLERFLLILKIELKIENMIISFKISTVSHCYKNNITISKVSYTPSLQSSDSIIR